MTQSSWKQTAAHTVKTLRTTLTKQRKNVVAVVATVALASMGVGAYAANLALTKPAISAQQAAQTAAAQVHGKAVEVDLEHKMGTRFYKVDVLTQNQKYKVRVDADNGKVLNSTPDADPVNPAKRDVAVDISKAIAAAEAKTNGFATEADLSVKYGQPFYKIETRNGTQKHKVRVDAQTGEVQVIRSKKVDW